jgi:hypothetical protein
MTDDDIELDYAERALLFQPAHERLSGHLGSGAGGPVMFRAYNVSASRSDATTPRARSFSHWRQGRPSIPHLQQRAGAPYMTRNNSSLGPAEPSFESPRRCATAISIDGVGGGRGSNS